MRFKLTNKQKLNMIEKYQNNIHVHPLTCPNRTWETHPHRDGEHDRGILVGDVNDKDEVYLKCRDCNYTQELSHHLLSIIKNGSEFSLFRPGLGSDL